MNPSNRPPVTRTSMSAVISFVFGVMSPVVLLGVLSTTITSTLAIVLGHVALVKIKRGKGAVLGRWQATAGLTLGYLLLPISLYIAPGYLRMLTGDGPDIGPLDRAAFLMTKAEEQIASGDDGFAHGNSPRAIRLAKNFSDTMTAAINATIVQEGRFGRQTAVDEQFDVFCQLNPDRVCFLAKVPKYRKYQDDARDALDRIAWSAGTAVVNDSGLPPGIELGIGLKGDLLYGTIVAGTSNQQRPSKTLDSPKELKQYFSMPDAKSSDQ